ncbi:putative cytochrome c protein [Candidatus Kuenenia stuttgartiensis]|uniref:Putative cytochrome c protein n=1 Tax=Kuenenia stuttgartiensis TaxID=174633 RepID=A0A6G7GMH8_KUEST|nr:c-type cytochrome [Candidatus Kuenenia stuttgartiensis]QII10407.1 putative cytochrome c protein [Candidatus Kuenenia stuttgartiensis]
METGKVRKKEKREEEKSYSAAFAVVSFILAAVALWAVVNEVVDRRPWKKYQKKFYQLEYEKAGEEYTKSVAIFESPEVQKKYTEAKENLKHAQDAFIAPAVQKEYQNLLTEEKRAGQEVESLKFLSVVARNKISEKEYLYGKTQNEQLKEEIAALEKENEERAMKRKVAENRLALIRTRQGELKKDVITYTNELDSYTSGVAYSKNKLNKFKTARTGLQVYQTYLEDINIVDRCMSCHPGIDKPESVSEEQPYASHPDRQLYLGNHPPEKFGCVLCHEGQSSATSGVKKAHGEVEYWLTPIYRGVVAQASCIRCHNGVREVKGAEVLWEGKKLFGELGCYGCHDTEGFGEYKDRIIGPGLRNIKNKVKPGWLTDWIRDPKAFRPTTRMPDFKLSEEESRAIAAYLWQHADNAEDDNDEIIRLTEEEYERGDFLFEQTGCLACHSYEEGAERTFAPNLAKTGAKMRDMYLVEWILNPKSKEPLTRMPNFRIDDVNARLIAGYLIGKTKQPSDDDETKNIEWLTDKNKARTGEALIKRYGCFGCHEIKGMEGLGKIGAELSDIGSKHIPLFDFGLLEKKILGEAGLKHYTENIGEARRAWLQAKLQHPRQFDEGKYKKPEDRLKMPDFRLSVEQIKALVIFLSGLRDEKLPEKYVASLSERQKVIAEGRMIINKYNCSGCHQFDLDRIYLNDGIELSGMVKIEEDDGVYFQLMEDNERYGHKAGDVVFIAAEDVAKQDRVTEIELASRIIAYHVEEGGIMPEEARVFVPPLLYGEGKKVQCEWTFAFLKEPFDLRPWLDVKMPSFDMSTEDATKLAIFLAAKDEEQYPYEYIEETKKGYIEKKELAFPGYLEAAKKLFESENVHCLQCHIRGSKMPEGEPADWAPDLMLAKTRLKPEWIKKWLLDPQSIQPGTKMPKFFREGEFQEYIPGTPEEQVEVMKDFLMNLWE